MAGRNFYYGLRTLISARRYWLDFDLGLGLGLGLGWWCIGMGRDEMEWARRLD